MDTGQGLNRLQAAPRVSRMMHHILHSVQSEVGGWVEEVHPQAAFGGSLTPYVLR